MSNTTYEKREQHLANREEGRVGYAAIERERSRARVEVGKLVEAAARQVEREHCREAGEADEARVAERPPHEEKGEPYIIMGDVSARRTVLPCKFNITIRAHIFNQSLDEHLAKLEK